MARNDNLADIEAQIGLRPFGPSKADELEFRDRIEKDPVAKALVQRWLVLKGLPDRTVRAALANSMATAYFNQPYLKAWRTRVNPSWDLLGGDDEPVAVAELSSTPAPVPVPSPPATSPLPSAMSSAQTEAWLKALFAQINTSVTKLVQDKLDATTLKLDDGAKSQIKTLAKDAAKETIAELMPPRTIEVRNVTTGASINVGLQHERFPLLLRAMQARDHRGYRMNIWLTGPTGSGKTSAAENASKALGLNFGSDGSLDADYKVLGFRNAAGEIISTQFLDIYEHGGIYCADEIDNWMPSALLSLNAALANGFVATPRGMIRRHVDACIIACANTWGLGATNEYVGRTRLDAASLDRFQPKIDWPYDTKLEAAVAVAQAGDLGREWFALVFAARTAAKAQGLKIIISPRATFNGIALLQQGFTAQEVVDMTMAAGISPEQKRSIGLDKVANIMTATMTPTVASATLKASGLGSTVDRLVSAINATDKPGIVSIATIRENYLAGNRLEAIKQYRESFGCDLAEAKRQVEAIAAMGSTASALLGMSAAP